MDFEPFFKVHNLVSVHPKSIILGEITNFDMIFHVVVSVYRLVKIRNGQFRWLSSLGKPLELYGGGKMRVLGNEVAVFSLELRGVFKSMPIPTFKIFSPLRINLRDLCISLM